MKKLFLLLFSVLAFTSQVRADVEWTIWEGEVTSGNAQGQSKLDFSTLAVGDRIYVYGSGDLSKAIYRISGDSWGTWTALQDYSPAVSDGNNYYHIITEEFLTNFNYSSDDTKSWAVGNWSTGTITKVTIRKGTSMIKTVLSTDSKSEDSFEYTIAATDFAKMVANDYLYLPASKRDKVDEKDYKVEFKEAENDWTTYETLWGPTHDIMWQVTSSTIDAGIKEHPLYIYGELYNTTGVYLYHPINSFKIGSIGMATFSANQEVTVPEGLTAYKATVSGNNVTLTQFTNNVIPANTGAIIVGDEGAVVEFEATSTGFTETSDLVAVTDGTFTIPDDEYDYYVLYAGTAESETNLELSTLIGSWGSWHPTEVNWNSETYTITYNGTASGEGGWVTKDWSNYDYLRLNFSSNTLSDDATFYVAYYEHDSNTTQATLSKGATTIDIPLDADYKNLNGNFSMYSNATSGSLTFESAALIDSDGASVAEFRKATNGTTLKENKSYLKIAKSTTSKLNIVFAEDENKQGEEQQGETNSIRNIANTNVNNNVVYNMNGQRVGSDYKGLVIVNGKKIIKK